MNTAVVPLWYSGLFRIVGRLAASHVSPSAMVPSCMSSIRLGVMNENAGRALPARSAASWVYGTSRVAHPDSGEKDGGGAGRPACSPQVEGEQFAGIDSSYAFHVSPCPKMLGAAVLQCFETLQSLSKVLSCLRLSPEVAPM